MGVVEGTRFDPFDDDVREALAGIDGALRGCSYMGGGLVADKQEGLVAGTGGCSLSLLFHNVRSAKGGNLELLEGEMRGWGVGWDVVGLAETWLDAESEGGARLSGYCGVFESRRERSGGGVALYQGGRGY